jgi:precorrin-6Y C5,15-methyltransferase (decarboxylating)
VTVVGIGDDGCRGLSSRAIEAVASAQVLVGGRRQLEFFPEFAGERLVVKDSIGPLLDRIAELALEHRVCVLASGDPLFFGIGSLVVSRIGAEHVEILPQPSSVQWAFARLGLPWHDAVFLSLHGRGRFGLVSRLRRAAKAAILTDPEQSPARIAAHLLEYGDRGWIAWVCENLAGPGERIRRFGLPELAELRDCSLLNVLVLVRRDPEWRPPPTCGFFDDREFLCRTPKKGLITKREVRWLSVAAMGIRPDSVVWDVGAGSGSVAIEASRLAPEGRVYAVEKDPESVRFCRENLLTHGADNVELVEGEAPEALEGLEAPDAVFVGGSGGALAAIVETAWARVRPLGRLVVNAATIETAAEAASLLRACAGRVDGAWVQISRLEPLGRHLRHEALNPVQIFAVEKPSQGGEG